MRFEDACPKCGVSPPLTNRSPKTTFSTISQLNCNFNGLCRRNEYDIDNRPSILKTTRVSYTVSKRNELWSRNGIKLERNFHPLFKNYAFSSLPGFTHALQKQNSTKLCQTGKLNGAAASRRRWRRILNINDTIEISLFQMVIVFV